eukprot:9420430-Pyramimonas_sp.AAC.2
MELASTLCIVSAAHKQNRLIQSWKPTCERLAGAGLGEPSDDRCQRRVLVNHVRNRYGEGVALRGAKRGAYGDGIAGDASAAPAGAPCPPGAHIPSPQILIICPHPMNR